MRAKAVWHRRYSEGEGESCVAGFGCEGVRVWVKVVWWSRYKDKLNVFLEFLEFLEFFDFLKLLDFLDFLDFLEFLEFYDD